MENSIIPTDVFGHLISGAYFGIINSLARSCVKLAEMVRSCAIDIADKNAGSRAARKILERRLPNDVLHSICVYDLDNESTIYAEFDRGTPVYWSQVYEDGPIIMGQHGCKYVLACDSVGSLMTREDCYVEARFEWGHITAYTDGTVFWRIFGVGNTHIKSRHIRWQAKITGYMQDGHICAHQVIKWMDPIVDEVVKIIGKAECPGLKTQHAIYDIRFDNEIDKEFDDRMFGVLGQFDSIEVKKC